MPGYSVEWTKDFEALSNLMQQPEIANFAFESDTALQFIDNDEIVRYAAITVSSKIVGVFVYLRKLDKLWEVHTCISNEARGKLAVRAARDSIKLLFKDTTAECLTTMVPASYTNVLSFTKLVGLKHCGYLAKAFNRNGEQQNLVLFDLTRMEALCL